MLEKEIGERIAALRVEKEETQQQLADSLGVKRETIKFWEGGNRQIKGGDIIKIARHFGISTDYLLGISDVKAPETSMQAVCDMTGLSEESIFSLQILKKFHDKELNAMLTDDCIGDILSSMSELDYYSKFIRDLIEDLEVQIFYEKYEENEKLLREVFQKFRFYRFEVFSSFMKLIDRLYKSYDVEKCYETLTEEIETYKAHKKYDRGKSETELIEAEKI